MYRRAWLTASLVITVLSATAAGTAAQTDDERPLRWGIDTEGGVPYFFKNPTDPDTYLGFEWDLVKALEKELGRKIEVKHCEFNSLIPALTRGAHGDFDFALNGLEITPERQREAVFARPYYIYRLQLVTRADDDRFSSLEECVGGSWTIGTLGATAAEQLLDKLGIPKKIYDDQEGPFKDLQLRRVDGVFMDLPIAVYYAKSNEANPYARKLKGLKLTGDPVGHGYYGIAVRKDNPKLKEQFDQALDRLLKSGELRRIYEKWDLWNDDQEKLFIASANEVEGEVAQWTFDRYFPLLLEGAEVTVIITVASMALAVLVGLVVALARMYGGPILSALALGYVEFFRGIPALLLLYFLYFGLPAIANYYNLPVSLDLSPWTAAILGLGLNYAAYEAEIYRAAIKAIPRGQWEAATSLGMSGPLTFRRIILPQAVRGILPPMTNDFVALFKDTSLVSVIAVVELNKQYQILTKSGGDFLQIGLATAFLYLVMSVPLGYLSRILEKRWGKVD